jgi:BirA family transcriptional regulator, biotin operon repressor / biotin---[acetyl-CoA-carboxylase] ligase
MTIFADYHSRWFDLECLLDETFVREIEFHRECTSTNDLALTTSAERKSPALFLTDSQTGGRGRGSNQWWARDGALTFSLRITPAEFAVQHERWPLVSLATAIAVADTLGHFASGHHIGLKWPNDVFLDHRKVCGILVEPPTGSNSELVIGVGINVANSLSDAPDDVRSIATSIFDATDTEHSPGDVLLKFLQRFETLVRELGDDTLNLQERWQKQCTLSGRQISLESGDHLVSGLCHGIADDGALQVETDGVIRSWFGGIVRRLE